VWGKVGVNLKTVFGQIWWNFEEGVWGIVGGIVKTMYGAELVEF